LAYAIAVAVAGTLAGIAASALSAGRRGESPALRRPVRHLTIEPGDTLWRLAQRHAPLCDPRAWVYDVKKANGIQDARRLAPGQTIIVPEEATSP